MFIKCDKCSNKIQIPDNFSGTTGKCPKCKSIITIKRKNTEKKEIICHVCNKDILVPINTLTEKFTKGKCPFCKNLVQFNKDSLITEAQKDIKKINTKPAKHNLTHKQKKSNNIKENNIEYDKTPIYQKLIVYQAFMSVSALIFFITNKTYIPLSILIIPTIAVFCKIYNKDNKTNKARKLNITEKMEPFIILLIYLVWELVNLYFSYLLNNSFK